MSKLVKNLVTEDLRKQLSGVSDALLVNVVGLDAIRTTKLRKEILAGRGGPQVLELVEAGYSGFLGDSGDVEDFENLEAHFKTHGLSA